MQKKKKKKKKRNFSENENKLFILVFFRSRPVLSSELCVQSIIWWHPLVIFSREVRAFNQIQGCKQKTKIPCIYRLKILKGALNTLFLPLLPSFRGRNESKCKQTDWLLSALFLTHDIKPAFTDHCGRLDAEQQAGSTTLTYQVGKKSPVTNTTLCYLKQDQVQTAIRLDCMTFSLTINLLSLTRFHFLISDKDYSQDANASERKRLCCIQIHVLCIKWFFRERQTES